MIVLSHKSRNFRDYAEILVTNSVLKKEYACAQKDGRLRYIY